MKLNSGIGRGYLMIESAIVAAACWLWRRTLAWFDARPEMED